jgi:hypothetical protein
MEGDSRIRERDSFVVCKVGTIIFSLATCHCARHFADDVGRALICALHVAHARRSSLTLNLSTNAHRDSSQRMLTGIDLISVEAHIGIVEYPVQWAVLSRQESASKTDWGTIEEDRVSYALFMKSKCRQGDG